MKNLRLFTVKYHGPTNSRGSRVSIYDERNSKRKSIGYRHELNNIHEMAHEYLKSIGIVCTIMGECKDACILGSDDFSTPLK